MNYSTEYVLPLVLGWLKAWDNNKGKGIVIDIGALPGVVVGVAAEILRPEDEEIRGGKYLLSKTRADFNFLLRQSEAKSWLKRVDFPESWRPALVQVPWEEKVESLFKGRDEMERATKNKWWTPDFSCWIITPAALHDAQVLAEMKKAGQKGPLGFRPPTRADE